MRIIYRVLVCLGLWLVPILARAQQTSPPVLPSNLYTTNPASSSSSPSSLAIGKFNTATFGSVGDAITLSGCTSTNSSKIITCPGGAFASADVGKITAGSSNCLQVGLTNPIASVQSATQVTLTIIVNTSCGGNLVFSYGTNNTTPFTAATTAANTLLGATPLTAPSGTAVATVNIPCGRFMVEPTSATLPMMNFTSSVSSGGQALVEGCGGSGTEIVAGEGWVFNTVGGGTLIGSSNASNMNVSVRGLSVNGLSITFPGAISTSIVNVGTSGVTTASSEFIEVANFTFTAGSPNINLIFCSGCILRQCAVHDSANAVGYGFSGDVITYALFGNNLGAGYHLTGVSSARFLYDSIDNCTLTGLSGLNACMEVDGSSANVRIIGSDFVVGPTANALDVNITAGNRVTMIGNRFLCSTGSGSGIRHISGDIHISESPSLCGGSTSGFGEIAAGANANFFDDGYNNWTNGSPAVIDIITGTYFPSIDGLYGKCTGVATASSTLGLYGTGPNVTLTTCTSATIGSGIAKSHAGNIFALYATATAAGVNASSGVVTVLKNGSATTATCTIGTGTSCKDEAHIVAYVAGDLISIQFTTQAADTLAGVKATVGIQ